MAETITIATSSKLDVMSKYKELLKESMGKDSPYIRAKETLEKMYTDNDELDVTQEPYKSWRDADAIVGIPNNTFDYPNLTDRRKGKAQKITVALLSGKHSLTNVTTANSPMISIGPIKATRANDNNSAAYIETMIPSLVWKQS